MVTSYIQDLSWLAIADAIAKATVLLAAAAIASALLRRRSAATRHLVWTLALLAIVALPVLSTALPRWQLPLLEIASEPAVMPSVSAPALARVAAPMPTIATSASQQIVTSTPVRPDARRIRAGLNAVSWPTLLFAIWAAGFAAVLARLAFGVMAVQWLARRTRPADDAPWFELACRLANDLRVPSVRFLRSTRATMPMACGIVRPAIVMPADADAWPYERLRIVLLHELAHVKRRDCLTHALAQLACALYWFNPLVWLAARRVRMERERACDDLVLAAGTRGSDYADQLLEIARAMRAGRFPAVLAGASLAMAYRSQLEGRLMAILDPKVPRAGMSRVGIATAAVLAGMLVLPLASVQPWAYAANGATRSAETAVTAHNAPVPGPQPAPAPRPAPTPSAKQPHVPEQDPVQGVIQGTTQGVVQSVVQGATQGVVQGVTQGVTRGIAAGTVAGVLAVVPFVDIDDQDEKESRGSRAAKADPKTIAALTAALKDTDADVRSAALHALVQLRDPSIYDVLIEALRDTTADVRQQAAFGLGQLRDKRAVPALSAALKDAVADVRQQAIFALGQLRDPASAEAILGAVRDTNADVRQQAVFALGQLGDRRAVEPLVSALKDADADVRQQAAFALGQLRDRSAVKALVIALKDATADVRQQAAFALGQLDDARAIEGLTAALRDPSADVRQQAAFALGQLAR